MLAEDQPGKKRTSDGRCSDLPLSGSLSCGRDHEICRFGRLRMPSMDVSPTRVMKTRAETYRSWASVFAGKQDERKCAHTFLCGSLSGTLAG